MENAVDAGAAFHVHNLDRNAEDALEQLSHRAQRGVSAAADAPRTNEINFALELEFSAGASRESKRHDDGENDTYELLHRFYLHFLKMLQGKQR